MQKRKLFISLFVVGIAVVTFLIINKTKLSQQKELINPDQLSNRVTQLEPKDEIKREIRELIDK